MRTLQGTLTEIRQDDFMQKWETDSEETHLKIIWLSPYESQFQVIGDRGLLIYEKWLAGARWRVF